MVLVKLVHKTDAPAPLLQQVSRSFGPFLPTEL